MTTRRTFIQSVSSFLIGAISFTKYTHPAKASSFPNVKKVVLMMPEDETLNESIQKHSMVIVGADHTDVPEKPVRLQIDDPIDSWLEWQMKGRNYFFIETTQDGKVLAYSPVYSNRDDMRLMGWYMNHPRNGIFSNDDLLSGYVEWGQPTEKRVRLRRELRVWINEGGKIPSVAGYLDSDKKESWSYVYPVLV